MKKSFLLLAFLVFTAGAVRAQHFIFEPYAGLSFNFGYSNENALGLESGALLGVGGKLKGFPPRFFLYFRTGQVFFNDDDIALGQTGARAEISRSLVPVLGGLRVVIPVIYNFRLTLDWGLGTMYSLVKYREEGYRLEYDKWFSVMEFGVGANFRLLRWLSLGLNYDYTYLIESEYGDMASQMIHSAEGGSRPGWGRLVATLGLHF